MPKTDSFENPLIPMINKYTTLVAFHTRVRERAYPSGTTDLYEEAVPASLL